MSLDKAILHGKEHRKPYYGCKSIAKSCRNHGSCGICQGNRLRQKNKMIDRMKDKEKEWNDEN